MTENNKSNKLAGREVLFEFHAIGPYMKVVAVDAATGTEISVQCPVTAGEMVFQRQALARLEYVLRKNGVIE
jgi:hypothetical protein